MEEPHLPLPSLANNITMPFSQRLCGSSVTLDPSLPQPKRHLCLMQAAARPALPHLRSAVFL